MYTLIFCGTFLAVGLSLFAAWHWRSGKRRVQGLLREKDPAEQLATVLRRRSLAQWCENQFQRGGVAWSFRSYLTWSLAGLLFCIVLSAAGLQTAAVLLTAAVVAGPWLYLYHRTQKRAELLEQQLPAALTLTANTIRSGGTLLQAVRAIARQMPNPIAAEFGLIERSLQLQVPVGAALDKARERIDSDEFTAVVIACKVAGQSGADLDSVLENVAREIVENRQYREVIRVASSEGRTSAKVVTAVPFVAGAMFYLSDPHYFDSMLASPLGQVLLVGSFLSIGVGWLAIRQIVDVRTW